MGHLLEQLLSQTAASSVTEAFIWLMLALFVVALVQGTRGKSLGLLKAAPGILVSLGILGTFIGIVIGLLHFNAHDIQNSIEGLLEGLKTAFVTSLVGSGLAIILKTLELWAQHRNAAMEAPDEVTAQHMYGAMKTQVETLKLINHGLAGGEEGSLNGQLKLLRTDVADMRNGLAQTQKEFQTELFGKMDQFATLLAKSATETVIDALRQVIADFNKHLIEQFGDNFKELNKAVYKMVDWQEQYKTHVESLENRIDTVVTELERTDATLKAISESLAGSERSIEAIDDHCKVIPGSMQELQTVIQTNQHQIGELERHLEAFVTMREKANTAIPDLQTRITALTDGFSEQLGGIMGTMHEGALEFGKSSDRATQAMAESANVVSSRTEQIGQDMSDAAKGFKDSVRDTLEVMLDSSKSLDKNMRTAVEQAATAIQQQVNQAVGHMQQEIESTVDRLMQGVRSSVETTVQQTMQSVEHSGNQTLGAVESQVRDATNRASDALNAQLNAMDEAIGRELQKVFKEMGSALATISHRIADDHAEYTKTRASGLDRTGAYQ